MKFCLFVAHSWFFSIRKINNYVPHFRVNSHRLHHHHHRHYHYHCICLQNVHRPASEHTNRAEWNGTVMQQRNRTPYKTRKNEYELEEKINKQHNKRANLTPRKRPTGILCALESLFGYESFSIRWPFSFIFYIIVFTVKKSIHMTMHDFRFRHKND